MKSVATAKPSKLCKPSKKNMLNSSTRINKPSFPTVKKEEKESKEMKNQSGMKKDSD